MWNNLLRESNDWAYVEYTNERGHRCWGYRRDREKMKKSNENDGKNQLRENPQWEYSEYVNHRGEQCWGYRKVHAKTKKHSKRKLHQRQRQTQHFISVNGRSTRFENIAPSGNVGQKPTKKSTNKKRHDRRNRNIQNEIVEYERDARVNQRTMQMQTQMVRKKQSVEMIHFTVFDQLLVALEEYEKYVDRKERGNWIYKFKRSFQTSKSTDTFYHAVHRLETQIHLFNCAFSGIRDRDVALDIWKKFQEFIQVRCSNEKMTQTDSHIFRIAVVFVDVFRKFPNGQRILEQSSESYESYKTAMYEKQVVGKYERLSKELTEAYQVAEKREAKSKKKPDPGRFYFSRDMLENRGKELDEGKKKFKKKEYRRMYKENNK